jgi:hypothetical protein
MNLGSFDVNGTHIKVATDYADPDGLVYTLTDASSQVQLAVTTYRGLDVAEGAPFSKDDLQAGLSTVLKRARNTAPVVAAAAT